MTIAYWCVFAALFLPYVFVLVAKMAGKGYDNRAPRPFEEKLTGFRQRAHWAHLNQFESFPMFAAAVIIAHQIGAAQGRIDQLAIGYLVFRLAYFIVYMLDYAAPRSLMWAGGMACIIAMFFQ